MRWWLVIVLTGGFQIVGHAAGAVTAAEWYVQGETRAAQRGGASDRPARNIILFIGDGMSLTTVSAARILQGQQRGESGEENLLFFETFPHTALAKTYNTNQQTPDSAGTMTALATGVKTLAGVLAVGPDTRRGGCNSAQGAELVSILELATLAGMRTGIVTTTRITHATPAALFAKSPERNWETDRGTPDPALRAGCRDIARQLIEFDVGDGIHVVLGGGRAGFMHAGQFDPEYPDRIGQRVDGRDLIREWRRRYPGGRYVWNLAQFDAVPTISTDRMLGLFEPSHMRYDHDRSRDGAGEPTLARMTRKAIKILERGESGYFLMVEAGRIDHAHHAGQAHRALSETLALDEAVRLAMAMTDAADTLIIVTADHGHAMTFAGYSQRGNPITGLVRPPGGQSERLALDDQGLPYTTLGYINGPGFRPDGPPDLARTDTHRLDFRPVAAYPLSNATHTGEDVPVYASGPGSHRVAGVMEQNVIFHIMVQAVPALAEMAQLLKDDEGLPDWRMVRP